MTEIPVYLITLESAIARRRFQEQQSKELGFQLVWHPAVSSEDLSDEIYLNNAFDWKRPLKKTEVCCFLSHLQIWEKIQKSSSPAVILEDDVILGNGWIDLISSLTNFDGIDYLCLETWNKKYLGEDRVIDSFVIRRLIQNSSGSAGYVLWPSGAEFLINKYKLEGVGLADGFINDVRGWSAWQLFPANVIQFNVAPLFGIDPSIKSGSLISNSRNKNPPIKSMSLFFIFKIRRLKGELRKAGFRILALFKGERCYVPFKNNVLSRR